MFDLKDGENILKVNGGSIRSQRYVANAIHLKYLITQKKTIRKNYSNINILYANEWNTLIKN